MRYVNSSFPVNNDYKADISRQTKKTSFVKNNWNLSFFDNKTKYENGLMNMIAALLLCFRVFVAAFL